MGQIICPAGCQALDNLPCSLGFLAFQGTGGMYPTKHFSHPKGCTTHLSILGSGVRYVRPEWVVLWSLPPRYVSLLGWGDGSAYKVLAPT